MYRSNTFNPIMLTASLSQAKLFLLIVTLLPFYCVSALSAERSFNALRLMAENDVPGAYSQVQKLRSELTESATARERVQLLNLQARIEFLLALTEQAAAHNNQALQLAVQTDYAVGQADALLNLAKIALNQGKLTESTELTFRSHNLLADIEHPALQAEVKFWVVLAYRRMGKEQESVKAAMEALELARKNEDPTALAYAYRGMALSFEQSHHNAEAHDYSQLMLFYARQLPSKLLEAFALQGLASRADDSENSESEQLMQQAISLYRQLATPFSLNIGLLTQARMLQGQDRDAERLSLLSEAVNNYRRYPNPLGLWYALMARSDAYQQLSELDKAEQDATIALQTAGEIGYWPIHRQSLDRLATIAAARQDYERAYQLSAESVALEQQATEQASHANTTQAVAAYEQDSQQRQIDSLNRHNAQQATELKEKHLQQRWLYTLLFGSLLILSGTAYFLLRLRRTYAQLRGLTSRLECVREEERKRIAQDLHDEMGQYLTTLRLEISAIGMLCQGENAKVVQRTHILKALIDHSIQVMRDIAASLRPAALDMGGVAALEWLAEEFTRRTSVTCQLDTTNLGLQLNDKYMTTVFRIVQESLTNITRHAQASEVNISLQSKGRDLTLLVSDNGRGFNPAEIKHQSFGLSGMRERALMLGGELHISSILNKGTRVSFFVRVPEDRRKSVY